MKYWIVGNTNLGNEQSLKTVGLILNTIKKIPTEDILIHLGNVATDNRWNDLLLRSSPCRKWLCLGRIDGSSEEKINSGWDCVSTEMTFELGDLKVTVSEDDLKVDGKDIFGYSYIPIELSVLLKESSND